VGAAFGLPLVADFDPGERDADDRDETNGRKHEWLLAATSSSGLVQLMCPSACAAAERSGAHARARAAALRSQNRNPLSQPSAAGAGIAAITLLLLFIANRRLGL
jgi:hypothetical protein